MENQDYTTPPQDTAELMQRIAWEWEALQNAIAPLTAAEMERAGPDGWSIKDNLSHLTAWEHFMLRTYLQRQPPHEVLGVDEATSERMDMDAINALYHRRNRDRPLAEVLAESRQIHQEAAAAVERMSMDDLMQPWFPDDPEARTVLAEIIGNTYEHYIDHRENIEKLH